MHDMHMHSLHICIPAFSASFPRPSLFLSLPLASRFCDSVLRQRDKYLRISFISIAAFYFARNVSIKNRLLTHLLVYLGELILIYI